MLSMFMMIFLDITESTLQILSMFSTIFSDITESIMQMFTNLVNSSSPQEQQPTGVLATQEVTYGN